MPLLGCLLLGLAGCGYDGANSLPLPGGVGKGDGYAITIVLDDATNLVVKETCRANDSVVGSVESVRLDRNLNARVVCRIRHEIALPRNATASVSQTSLLGERYVALGPPTGQRPSGRLAPGSVLRVGSAAEPNAEVVLGALSQVLNGGSLGKIDTITRELTAALQGTDLDATFERLDRVVGTLDKNRDSIDDSLTALNDFSGQLAEQRDVLADALDEIPDGLQVLDEQRPALIKTLRSLSRLSDVLVPLIKRTRADTVANLRHLTPILRELNKNGEDISLALERLSTFPFPANARATLKGDYGGMYASILIDADLINALLPPSPVAARVPGAAAATAPAATKPPGLDGLSIPGLPLPQVPNVPKQQAAPDVAGLMDLLNRAIAAGARP